MKTLSILAAALALTAATGTASASTYGMVSLGEQMLPHASLPAIRLGIAHNFADGVVIQGEGGSGCGDGVTSQSVSGTIQSPLIRAPFGARLALEARAGGVSEFGPTGPGRWTDYVIAGVAAGAPISPHTSVGAELLTGPQGAKRATIAVAVSFTPRTMATLSDTYFRADGSAGLIQSHRISLGLIERF